MPISCGWERFHKFDGITRKRKDLLKWLSRKLSDDAHIALFGSQSALKFGSLLSTHQRPSKSPSQGFGAGYIASAGDLEDFSLLKAKTEGDTGAPPQQSRNSSPTTSTRSPSMNIPGSFIPPRDTTRVTQRTASTAAPRPASEQPSQPTIDLNRSPTRRSHTPTGYKPRSGPWQPRPSYSKTVSSTRNSSSSTPTVVPTTSEKTTEHLVAHQTSKREQLKGLGLGPIPPSARPTLTSSPVETAQLQAIAMGSNPQTGGFAKELERRLSPIAGKSSAPKYQPLSIDEEEEEEVATSISIFRSGTGQECAASTRELSRNHPTLSPRKGSPARSVNDTSNLIDRIIASHEKLRADMSSQTALFNKTLVQQLGSTLAENME
ncbi:hypothetical protein F5887DRAFT_915174 [Amanita rubescens]|nr:hypothetical protein F5887DRAFT_915174 [Amanita rubescens]